MSIGVHSRGGGRSFFFAAAAIILNPAAADQNMETKISLTRLYPAVIVDIIVSFITPRPRGRRICEIECAASGFYERARPSREMDYIGRKDMWCQILGEASRCGHIEIAKRAVLNARLSSIRIALELLPNDKTGEMFSLLFLEYLRRAGEPPSRENEGGCYTYCMPIRGTMRYAAYRSNILAIRTPREAHPERMLVGRSSGALDMSVFGHFCAIITSGWTPEMRHEMRDYIDLP